MERRASPAPRFSRVGTTENRPAVPCTFTTNRMPKVLKTKFTKDGQPVVKLTIVILVGGAG